MANPDMSHGMSGDSRMTSKEGLKIYGAGREFMAALRTLFSKVWAEESPSTTALPLAPTSTADVSRTSVLGTPE
jgi:hypothetical protein